MRGLIRFGVACVIVWSAAAGAADPEHGGDCAMGAAMGIKQSTDCAIVWISPQDKLYCFSSEQAKQTFLKDPASNEKKARAFWKDPQYWQERLKKRAPES